MEEMQAMAASEAEAQAEGASATEARMVVV